MHRRDWMEAAPTQVAAPSGWSCARARGNAGRVIVPVQRSPVDTVEAAGEIIAVQRSEKSDQPHSETP